MIQLIKNISLKLLLIIGIMQYSFENSILDFNNIKTECDKETGRYLFTINAYLSGNMSKSDFDNYKIEINDKNHNVNIQCDFPEENSENEKTEVSIPCYIENYVDYLYYSVSFIGESSELQLNKFKDIKLGYISCRREMTLTLGEIKDQECDSSEDNLLFEFKIEISNKTIIPEDLMHQSFYLNLMSEKEESGGRGSNCFIENNNNMIYLDCELEIYRALDNSLYLGKGDFHQYINDNIFFIKNNDKKYIGKDIFCYDKHKVNYLDIFKGNCKNGAFYFSIDFEDLIDDDESKNEMINSKKVLIELKGKVDSKSSNNFCYLENKNKKDKYDLSKYKLNCVAPTFEDTDNRLQFYNLFSKYYILNYLSLLLFNDELYCFKEKDYITAFYFYSDECSNNNTFKILASTTFNEFNVFNSTLDDKIEIPIISPFNDKAICQISSILLEPFIEFICSINNNQININNYEKITFGNVTTKANYDDIYPIEFGDFSGEKHFGRYCSKNKTKCSEIIEYDYGVNSMNKNNPKIYEYSLCLISNEDYNLKKSFEIEFNEEVIGNCLKQDIYNLDNIKNNISQYKVNCSINEEHINKFPLLKHFNPLSFTFYNNVFKDLNLLTNDLLNISEIDMNLKINVNNVKDYCILNESYALIILSCNISSSKDEKERVLYNDIELNDFHIESLLNNKFGNILENNMNIIFIDYNLNESDANEFRELELICLVENDFTKMSNIVVKNEFIYQTFYNNFTIIWRNKTLVENIIFNGIYGIYFSEQKDYYGTSYRYYYNSLSFNIFIYTIYNFSFYNENEENSDNIIFNIKINNNKSEDNKLVCQHPYLYRRRNSYLYYMYCQSKSNIEYYNNLKLNFGDIITFEESNYKIKNINNKELKIFGLNNLSYKHLYDSYISFDSRESFCKEEGFTFKLNYYMDSDPYNENMTKYMINNFIDPTTNEIINGTCKFNINFNTYYNKLSCIIKSPLIDINNIYFNNTLLDKEDKSLPDIKIRKDYIDFDDPIFCAKNLVFTINKIKEADCVDNTYQFKLIGTLSKEVKKMNKIFIRDIIGNDLKIYCNNLSFYEKEDNINYYSFNCYVVNDTLNEDYLNITLLNRPLFSDIITIKYSNEYENVPLILKYKCNNRNNIRYRFRELYNEFNTTINSIIDLFDESPDIEYNIFSFKILLELNEYSKDKLSDFYDKHFENYLTLPIEEPFGISFCYLKEKNVSRLMILECYGIVDNYEFDEEEIKFKNINSLNMHGNDKYSQTISLLGLINQNIDENDIVYPKYIVDSISSVCYNNLYRFNITGIIDNNDYYDESIPKIVKLNLEEDLWANCEVLNNKEISKLIIECIVISDSSLNGVDIKFNKSKLEIDDKNMIIDGLNDFIKENNEIIGLNVTCGNSNILDDNIDKTDINNSNSTLFETDEPKIDEMPIFIYSYIDNGYCSEDSYIFNIYGNLSNNSNIIISEIELEINLNNINYNITCNLESVLNKNVTYKFKCDFIPHQYFSKLIIYPKANFSNLKILNWENEEITINNENLCTKEIINPIKYINLNACDSNSDIFSFEIEMESTIKKGYIKNESLILNISKPYFIDEINCNLTTRNLSSNIKAICKINDLSQDKRITDGIFINGIRKNNIFDEYFITNNNEYIKINDLYGAKFKFVECPQNFEIIHCKELNKTERKCYKCHKNYYLTENQTECLTCSQLNEGCSSCNNNGSCAECLEGFNKNGSECVINNGECKDDEYGPKCKTCLEIDSNCKKCSKSGFCLECNNGYYLSGIDEDSKCIKCLSTCEECESINKCTKCNDGLLLNNGSCDSCLLYIDGCKECSEIDKCNECYNSSLLNYILNNNKCEKQKEDKKDDKTKLKFERFDSYQKEDNKVHFKPHFLLLDNILFNTKLFLSIIIQMKKILTGDRYRYLRLRGLDDDTISVEKNIICDQYGDALGNSNGGYLANYKCSFEENENEDEDYEVLSIEPTKMEIKDNENKIIQDFEAEKKPLNVNEIEPSSLDEEYNKYKFIKITIRNTSNIVFKDQLTFNIIGDVDSYITEEKEYEISLKDNNNGNINATCKLKANENNLETQNISCISKIDEKTEYLTFENGMFASKKNNSDKIIVSSDDGVNVIMPKKKSRLSIGFIIGIALACLIVVCVATFLIIKFIVMKKKIPEQPNIISNENKIKNDDRSKDIILNNK